MLDVRSYSGDNLCNILFEANLKRTPLELITEDLNHVKYLKEYLGSTGLNANFYIKESGYISVDYLTDYSFYYSKNFIDYGNKCVRLHFFNFHNKNKSEFDKSFWNAIIHHNDVSSSYATFFDECYLGFIVIRPIPKFIIGYTILRHYNFKLDSVSFDKSRSYWGTKDYSVHVFGVTVKINSLAFISQDSNVAACATIAIWSMLQLAVENYYINLKSPYEITKDAGLTVHDGNRIFPNNGLSPVSICNAITKSNLATEIRLLGENPNPNSRIKTLVHAYSKIGLPIILGLKIRFNNKFGKHATAIAGHSIVEFEPAKKSFTSIFRTSRQDKAFVLRAQQINKLYMHDDQWGPFSRLKLIGKKHVSTSWNEHTAETKKGEVYMLIIPVFQKIRIPVEDIELYSLGLNQFLNLELGDAMKGNFNWDIQLYFSNDFKNEVRLSGLLTDQNPVDLVLLKNLLMEPMPKYIWVSTLYVNNAKIMNFIYDATGLRHTTCLLFGFSYYSSINEKFIERVTELNVESITNAVLRHQLEVFFNDSTAGFLDKISFLTKSN
jgi:hypothetical protein